MKTAKTTFRNLITNSMNTKQISKIAICILVVLSTFACKKETGITVDTIKPDMTFKIDGVRTFNSDTDFTAMGILYLEPGVNYKFTTTINDTGGVKKLEASLDTVIKLSNIISATSHTDSLAYDVLGSAHNIYTITGTESDPYTRFVMTGILTPRIYNQQDKIVYIYCNGDDYNPSNTSHIKIKCIITNQPPSGYGWKRL